MLIISRLLQDAGTDGGRWRNLIERVDELSREQHGVVVESLLNMDPNQFVPEDRAVVWDSLREVISKHREFPEADWVLPGDLIDRLERAYYHFEPEDLLSKRVWLFSSNPSPPEALSHDWHERQEAIESARLNAVHDLVAEGGLTLLLETAERVEQPGELGFAAGKSELLEEVENDLLITKLSSGTKYENAFARGFIVGRIQIRGEQWVAAKVRDLFSSWAAEQRADFFACMSFEGRAWDLVEAAGDSLPLPQRRRMRARRRQTNSIRPPRRGPPPNRFPHHGGEGPRRLAGRDCRGFRDSAARAIRWPDRLARSRA